MDIIENSVKNQSEIFIPEFYRLSDYSSKLSLQRLLSSSPQIEITDEIVGQVRELIKSRNPKGLKEENLDQLTQDYFGDLPTDEFGVWVYYPWLNKLVHILDEDEFIELRTNRNQNKITVEEREILSKKIIGIIGLSVGQSIALSLIMERGCGELRLADFDRLELSNLNRIRTPLYNIGQYKVVATAREISEIDPFIKVKIFTDGITTDNMSDFMLGDQKLDLLVDECDGLDIKIKAREFARENRIPVIMDTSDRGMLDVERFDLDGNLPILHGYVEGLNSDSLVGLTNEQKIPYVMRILGVDQLSPRAKASALEVEQSISTWPQLASSVILGGAVGADVARRIFLRQFNQSGRYYVDIHDIIKDPVEQEVTLEEEKSELSVSEVKLLLIDNPVTELDNQKSIDFKLAKELVEAACQAPSGGNCQPWKWLLKNNALVLVHDKVRSDSLLDYNNTGTFLGFGAALENLEIKAASQGLSCEIELTADSFDSDTIAIIRFFDESVKPLKPKLDEIKELSNYIFKRVTNRKSEGRFPIESKDFQRLSLIANSLPGMEAEIVSDSKSLNRLGKLIGEIDRLWILDEKGHGAFMDEIRWTPEEVLSSRDGLDIETLEMSKMDVTGLSLTKDHRVVSMLNNWGLGRILTKMSTKSVDSASGMVLFTMPSADYGDFITGGRAVERFWLEATKMGLSLQPMSISIFLFGRLIQGEGAGLTKKMKESLPKFRKELLDIFKVSEERGLVFMMRISKASQPSARALRLTNEQVLFS